MAKVEGGKELDPEILLIVLLKLAISASVCESKPEIEGTAEASVSIGVPKFSTEPRFNKLPPPLSDGEVKNCDVSTKPNEDGSIEDVEDIMWYSLSV